MLRSCDSGKSFASTSAQQLLARPAAPLARAERVTSVRRRLVERGRERGPLSLHSPIRVVDAEPDCQVGTERSTLQAVHSERPGCRFWLCSCRRSVRILG